MGSDLYVISVLAKKGTSISLDFNVIHPDSMYISDNPSFVLLALHEAIGNANDCALAKEASFDDMLDTPWMEKYAKGFIRSVKKRDIKKTKKSMTGRLDITVSDPAWIAHLEKGATWDSRTFDVAQRFDNCEPITPSTTTTVSDDDAFTWIPREYFMSYSEVDPKTPALLEMAAYAESAYTKGETVKRPSRKQLDAWLGRAVMIDDAQRGTMLGSILLVKPDASVVFASYHVGGGSSFGTETQITSISRPVLKAGRRGSRVDCARAVADAAITTAGGKKSGTTLELTLRIPPDGRKVPLASETDVLRLLTTQAIDRDSDSFRKNALATQLQEDLEANELEGVGRLDDLYPYVAKQYIASWSLDGKKANAVKLTGSSAEIHAALSTPWPTVTLHVEVTDKKWLAHFDPDVIVKVDSYPLPKPKAPKKKAPAPVYETADARVVLYTDKNVWVGERNGASLTTRSGPRSKNERKTATKQLASPEKAQAELDKLAKAKLRDGYKRAPSREEAAATVWKRMGLAFEDASGACVITKVAKVPAGIEYKPKDQIEALDRIKVTTVEEIAVVIAKHTDSIYADSHRPAAGTYTTMSTPLS